jgi:histidine triad (HIT) family protein
MRDEAGIDDKVLSVPVHDPEWDATRELDGRASTIVPRRAPDRPRCWRRAPRATVAIMSGDCVFCAIVAHEQPASIVAEDDYTVAFMDINPWRVGHTLVVPRHHAKDLVEIDAQDLARVYTAAQRLAERMREHLGCERVHLWNSCGEAAGQVIMHFHLHVIPGRADDPDLPLRPSSPPAPAEIASAAQALRG